MRFFTIWSIPSMPIRERLNRTLDWLFITLSMWLPKKLRYWVTMLEIGKATADSPNVPATTLDTILRNLGGGKDDRQ